MYNNSYPARSDTRFSYADGYCSVFPKGLEKQFKSGKGHIIIANEYIVVVNNDTPQDIEKRFLEEYAKYYAETRNSDTYIHLKTAQQ